MVIRFANRNKETDVHSPTPTAPSTRGSRDQSHRPTSPGRLTGDSGAALVELAIVAPVLILLVLGMAEMGMAWRASTVASDAVRQAALDASSPAGDRNADLYALETLASNIDPTTIKSVIIYKADTGNNGAAPTGCAGNGTCNTYGPADLVRALNGTLTLDEASCAGAVDENWCPLDRDSPDQLGIEIVVEHNYVTGIIPGSGILTIEDRATFPVLRN